MKRGKLTADNESLKKANVEISAVTTLYDRDRALAFPAALIRMRTVSARIPSDTDWHAYSER